MSDATVEPKTEKGSNAFPAPKSVAVSVSHDVLAEMIKESAEDEDTAFVVVDVRRSDFEGYMIKGAVNIPAQSFYLSLETWSKVFGDRTVVFHCSSSSGRGPRCAAWYQDYLEEHQLEGQSAVLKGGIKEWIRHYENNPELIREVPNL